jgi:hypothetical protein
LRPSTERTRSDEDVLDSRQTRHRVYRAASWHLACRGVFAHDPFQLRCERNDSMTATSQVTRMRCQIECLHRLSSSSARPPPFSLSFSPLSFPIMSTKASSYPSGVDYRHSYANRRWQAALQALRSQALLCRFCALRLCSPILVRRNLCRGFFHFF